MVLFINLHLMWEKKLDHKVYLYLILSYAVSFLLEFYIYAEVILSIVATC